MISVKVSSLLDKSLQKQKFETLSQGLDELKSGKEDVLRSTLDLAFKTFLTDQILSDEKRKNPDLDQCQLLVQFAINAARNGYAAAGVPISMLSDMFDLLTLDNCQVLFQVVESNVEVWKEEAFFKTVKNHLLRICNDLLRRLSRTQNTVFCGRILVFLAKFFPLTERSGLNVISEFNLDNTTVFGEENSGESEGNNKTADDEDSMEQDGVNIEEDQKNLAIDYALYRKFWQLQDFFRNPTQCYDRTKWRVFSTFSYDVLNIFQSFKLDSLSGKRQKMNNGDAMEMNNFDQSEEEYFAKYLTNQNLLQLQLADSSFRRFILVQFLILFQYLKSSVKFKNDVEVLTDDQSKWITNSTDRVFKLLKETPPEGEKFANSVEHILKREEQWNNWKNDGCPPFTAIKAPLSAQESSKRDKKESVNLKRKRRAGLGDEIFEAQKKGLFVMGNANLTKLWNVCPDNLEACSADERDFLPSLEDYFDEAHEQIKPENGIEEAYRKVNDGSWGWRALRLMARKSPHFFTYGNTPIAKLPDYLKSMLAKMYKDTTLNLSASSSAGTVENAAAATNGASTPVPCSTEFLQKLSKELGENWKKLIPKLGLTKEQGEEIEKTKENNQDRAMSMLEKWVSIEKEGATPEEICYILGGLKMKEIADKVMSTTTSPPTTTTPSKTTATTAASTATTSSEEKDKKTKTETKKKN